MSTGIKQTDILLVDIPHARVKKELVNTDGGAIVRRHRP